MSESPLFAPTSMKSFWHASKGSLGTPIVVMSPCRVTLRAHKEVGGGGLLGAAILFLFVSLLIIKSERHV